MDIFDALKCDDFQKVKKLIKKDKTLVNAVNKTNQSVLMVAAWLGRYKIVKLLLKHDVDVNYVGLFNESALTYASCYKRYKIVSLLVDHGANINHKNLCNQDSKYFLADKDWMLQPNNIVNEEEYKIF